MSDFDADVIVIGSGPAGVSAALPLVEAGRRVLMIDGGDDARADATAPWRRMLGGHLEALTPDDGLSPKLRGPEARRVVGAFTRHARFAEQDFLALGALARGGLSRIWGGGVAELDNADMLDWPISTEDLQPSYQAVAQRVGVSGVSDDEMAGFYGSSTSVLPAPPLGPTAAVLLERYARRKAQPGFALGRARNALLTVAQDDRQENRQICDLSLGCLWGCERGAIYDARQDIARLRRHPNFVLRDRTVAVRLARTMNGWEITTADGAPPLRTQRLVVAAGTLGSLHLIAPLLDPLPALRLENSPVIALPLLVRKRLGADAPAQGHALAQLGFRLACSAAPGDYVSGAIYEITALPPSSFAARLPFGRRAATAIVRALAPAMLVATVYFPGRYSANEVTVEASAHGPRIHIRGGVSDRFDATARTVRRQLKKIWRRLGARVLPGGSLATAGTDAHLGGLFPMGNPAPHGTSRFGELNAAPGLFVVDGAVLPSIPSKFTTLTIMANADRIGRHLAGAA
jgi:choline dehydrogenase-like flavoprotein